jgi:hypothetical protein
MKQGSVRALQWDQSFDEELDFLELSTKGAGIAAIEDLQVGAERENALFRKDWYALGNSSRSEMVNRTGLLFCACSR